MLVDLRRRHIYERIVELGWLSSAQAAKEFHVSPLTIRRDLEVLEQQGLVQRVRGGAQVAGTPDVAYARRAARERDAKRRIGEFAADLVQDGETVYLDAGTTTLEIARALKTRARRDVRVVTHAVNLAAELVALPHLKVFSIGGEIFEETYAATGAAAVDMVGRYRYDRLFLACMGFDAQAGITNVRVPEVEIKAAALANARWTALVADASKWGVHTFARIAPLDRVQAVVTDDRLPDRAVETLRHLGLEVHLVP